MLHAPAGTKEMTPEEHAAFAKARKAHYAAEAAVSGAPLRLS